MKKVTLVILLVANALAAMAQTEKGSKLIGASLFSMGFTSQDYSTTSSSNVSYEDKSKTKNFNIGVSPSVAWFIKNDFALGLHVSVTYTYSQTTYPDNGYVTSSKSTNNNINYSVGPHARYYVGGNDKGKLFAELGASIGFFNSNTKSTSDLYTSEGKSKSKGNYIASMHLGYEHFVSKNIGLFGSFGVAYGSAKSTSKSRFGSNDDWSERTTTTKSLSIPVTIGLQIHLEPCKKKE